MLKYIAVEYGVDDMEGKLNFVFPEDFDSTVEEVTSMVESIDSYVAELPEIAKIVHLRLADGLDLTDQLRNRISWYMANLRKAFSVIDPTIVFICNQFDMESDDIDFRSFDFELPDMIDPELLTALIINLSAQLQEEESVIDTSVSEILLPS